MNKENKEWEEEFPELLELLNSSQKEEEDFKLSGAGDMYELKPMSTNAYSWVFQNLKFEIYDLPSVIYLNKDGMEKMVTTILQDGLNFSLTRH